MSAEKWMAQALTLAHQAQEIGEVPIGAVLVYQDEVIGEGYNQTISLSDPTAHAEIIALRQAAKKIKNYRLLNTTLYTTLEPCCMCAGALVHARIKTLYFATSDPKAGASGSQFNLTNNTILNHRIECHQGLMQQQSAQLLTNFFKQRRY